MIGNILALLLGNGGMTHLGDPESLDDTQDGVWMPRCGAKNHSQIEIPAKIADERLLSKIWQFAVYCLRLPLKNNKNQYLLRRKPVRMTNLYNCINFVLAIDPYLSVHHEASLINI